MVQNVITFSHKANQNGDAMRFDFSKEISQLNADGWTVKQVASSVAPINGSSCVSVTVLAEKSE